MKNGKKNGTGRMQKKAKGKGVPVWPRGFQEV